MLSIREKSKVKHLDLVLSDNNKQKVNNKEKI